MRGIFLRFFMRSLFIFVETSILLSCMAIVSYNGITDIVSLDPKIPLVFRKIFNIGLWYLVTYSIGMQLITDIEQIICKDKKKIKRKKK